MVCFAGDDNRLAFTVNPDGTYSFAAGGNHNFNLTSGHAFLQANKNPYSTRDGSLKLQREGYLQFAFEKYANDVAVVRFRTECYSRRRLNG